MKPVLTIVLLATLAACSNRSQQTERTGNSQVTMAPVQETVQPQTQRKDHLYDLPLKGVVFWLKNKLHR